MKILMLNYEFPPIGGGSANANYHILKEFSKYKNIEIDMVTSSINKFKKVKFADNITIYRLNVNKKNIHYQSNKETFMWSIKTLFFVRKLFKKNNYDLCHCWSGWPSGFFGYINKKRQPYLIALRGTDVPGFNPRLKLLDSIFFRNYSKIIWNKSSKVIANSEGLRKLAKNTWNRKIDVIYNGIDTVLFKPSNTEYKEIRLIIAARLIQRKGISYLIKAMPRILEVNSNVKLDIIGEGPLMHSLKSLTIKLKLTKNINFLGYIKHEDLPNYYQKAKILILPSFFEGMSNTVLEAMASGLAIISTDTGGTKELLKNNGIIIKKKSSIDISNAVIKLINDKKKLDLYCKNSRKLAEKMSWKKVAEHYYTTYKKIIN